MKTNKKLVVLTSLLFSAIVLGSASSYKNVSKVSAESNPIVETEKSLITKGTKPTKTYSKIADGWNNTVPQSAPGYHHTILSFGTWNVDFMAENHNADTTNRAKSTYDIGQKMTINGLPMYKIAEKYPQTTISYAHGYNFLYIAYPDALLTGCKDYMVPTLHIPEGTEFMDVLLGETTLKCCSGSWFKNSSPDFKLDNPINLDDGHLISELPQNNYNGGHAVFTELPADGVELAFTIKTGNYDTTATSKIIVFDGFYNTYFQFYPAGGIIQVFNKLPSVSLMQQSEIPVFAQNTDYLFEIKCVATTSSFNIKIAIDHCLVVDSSVNANYVGKTDIWTFDQFEMSVFDYAITLPTYNPTIEYGGSSYYDFMEGDPIYDFTGVVTPVNMYDETVGYSDLQFIYDEGAVTAGKYNAGNWKLIIKLALEGYEVVTKEININVHGLVSTCKIYYGDADPVEATLGSKLTPPADPEPYHDDEYDYVFDGWYFEGGMWDFENDVVQGDMHLVAHYKKSELHYVITVKYEGIDKTDDKFYMTKNSNFPFALLEENGASFEVFLNNEKITSLTVSGDVTILVKYSFVFNFVEAKEATCTEDGNEAYYYCELYEGYYFADPEGREQIKNPFISKFYHNIIHLNYTNPTCYEVGNVDCYYCKNCHKHFTDAEGNNELIDWSIEMIPHQDLTHHEAKPVTCEVDGNVEYWTCANEPGVYYADEACSTKLDDIVIHALGHDYRAPTYTWKETSTGYECVASIKCTKCNHEITETKQGAEVIVRESSCSREGQVAYSVRFDDSRFNAQTKVVSLGTLDHDLTYFAEVAATKEKDGVKEHYQCNECHEYFIKDGDKYIEVQFSELIIKYVDENSETTKKGCGGSIIGESIILVISSITILTTLVLRRKEER